jgi:hypothetical protein
MRGLRSNPDRSDEPGSGIQGAGGGEFDRKAAMAAGAFPGVACSGNGQEGCDR